MTVLMPSLKLILGLHFSLTHAFFILGYNCIFSFSLYFIFPNWAFPLPIILIICFIICLIFFGYPEPILKISPLALFEIKAKKIALTTSLMWQKSLTWFPLEVRNFLLFTWNCRLNCRTSTISTHCYKCSTIPQVLQFLKFEFRNVLQFLKFYNSYFQNKCSTIFMVFYKMFYNT